MTDLHKIRRRNSNIFQYHHQTNETWETDLQKSLVDIGMGPKIGSLISHCFNVLTCVGTRKILIQLDLWSMSSTGFKPYIRQKIADFNFDTTFSIVKYAI